MKASTHQMDQSAQEPDIQRVTWIILGVPKDPEQASAAMKQRIDNAVEFLAEKDILPTDITTVVKQLQDKGEDVDQLVAIMMDMPLAECHTDRPEVAARKAEVESYLGRKFSDSDYCEMFAALIYMILDKAVMTGELVRGVMRSGDSVPLLVAA